MNHAAANAAGIPTAVDISIFLEKKFPRDFFGTMSFIHEFQLQLPIDASRESATRSTMIKGISKPSAINGTEAMTSHKERLNALANTVMDFLTRSFSTRKTAGI